MLLSRLGLLGEDQPYKSLVERLCGIDASFRLDRKPASSNSLNSLWLLPSGPCSVGVGWERRAPLGLASREACWRA